MSNTSPWFNYSTYMANKLAQLVKAEPENKWDMDKLFDAFASAGYKGAEGAERHFLEHGQHEDVAPNAYFNPSEYYRAKAAEFYGKSNPKLVTDVEELSMKHAIKDSGMNAWTHYKNHGTAEGVNPSNSFDTLAYMNAKVEALNKAGSDIEWTVPLLEDAFRAANLSALEHFMIYGGNGNGEVVNGLKDGKIPSEFQVKEENKVKPDSGSTHTTALTTAPDNVAGTDADDLIQGFTAAAGGTFNGVDNIDGGGGNNRLELILNGADADAASIKNVQTIDVTAGTAHSFDALRTVGADIINSVGSTAKLTVNNITNLSTGVGIVRGSANADFKYADTAVAGAADVANLTLNGATAGTVKVTGATATGGGIETIQITATGADSKGVTLDMGTDLKTIKVKGDHKLGLTVATAVNATTIDASENTAGVDIDASALTGDVTITGTAKDDRIVMANANVAAADTITGGSGSDTFAVKVAASGTYNHATQGTKVTGFEKFELIGIHSGTDTYTAALDGAFAHLTTAGGSGGNDTFAFTGGAANTTLVVSEDCATVNFALKTNTAADAITVDVNGAKIDTGLVLTGIEDVTLISSKDELLTANVVDKITASDATKLTVKGDKDLTAAAVALGTGAVVSSEGFTGDKLSMSFGSVIKSYTGFNGENDITLHTNGLSNAGTFAAGTGTKDKLTVTGVTGTTLGALKVSGFETLAMAFAGNSTLDLRDVTGLSDLVLTGAACTITADRLNLVETKVTADLSANGATTLTALTLNAKDDGTLNMHAKVDDTGDAITTLTVDSGVKALNLTTKADAANDKLTIATFASTDVKTVTVSGDADVKFTNALNSAVTEFNAAGSKGDVEVVLGNAAGTTATITGGTGDDTLTIGAGGGILKGGAGADTLTGAAGVDKFVFDHLDSKWVDATAKTFDTVATFTSGSDKLVISGGPAATATNFVTGTDLSSGSSVAVLLAEVKTNSDTALASNKGGYVLLKCGTQGTATDYANKYILVHDADNSGTLNADDTVILLNSAAVYTDILTSI